MKKLLVLFLTVCILAISVMPAFAVEADTAVVMSTPDQVKPASRVDEFYSLFVAMETAFNGGDINALKTAVDDFSAYSENLADEFTEDEIAQLESLFGTDIWEALGLMLDIAIKADGVIALNDAYNDFMADQNPVTAVGVVVLYEEILDYEDDEFLVDVKKFLPDIDEVYEWALVELPSERVFALYRAHQDILTAFDWFDVVLLEEAVVKFLDAYNAIDELTFDEKSSLGQLYGKDADEAMSIMLADYINANIILDTDEVINNYYEEVNKETAEALVYQYEAIFLDESYVDEELRELANVFFFDFEDLYNEAKYYLDENVDSGSGNDTDDESKEPQKAPQSTKDEASNKTNTAPVKTGNSTVAVVAVASMLLALLAIGVAKRRVR